MRIDLNSFSLQEAVAGVSGEESLVAVKETSNKRLFGTKIKRSSKNVKYAYKSDLVKQIWKLNLKMATLMMT